MLSLLLRTAVGASVFHDLLAAVAAVPVAVPAVGVVAHVAVAVVLVADVNIILSFLSCAFYCQCWWCYSCERRTLRSCHCFENPDSHRV